MLLGYAPRSGRSPQFGLRLTPRKVRDLPHIRRNSREKTHCIDSLMSKRIIILGGCGAMGSEATRDLARTSDFEEIVIADADLKRAEALASELGGGRVRAIRVDANDEAALTESLRGFDVVANCTTYHFGLIVTRAAINAGVNYLDLGGLYNTPKQLLMDEDARRAGVTICLGSGATPGVTNLMARAAADQLGQVDEA